MVGSSFCFLGDLEVFGLGFLGVDLVGVFLGVSLGVSGALVDDLVKGVSSLL